MKISILSIAFIFSCHFVSAQSRYYEQNISQYQPLSFDEMAAIGQMNAQSYEKRNKLFNEYYNLAMKSFNAKNYLATINHCNSALNTRLHNSNVYYLRGVSYINMGLKRDGKKDLKKSAKSGNVNAKLYLNNMKSK